MQSNRPYADSLHIDYIAIKEFLSIERVKFYKQCGPAFAAVPQGGQGVVPRRSICSGGVYAVSKRTKRPQPVKPSTEQPIYSIAFTRCAVVSSSRQVTLVPSSVYSSESTCPCL